MKGNGHSKNKQYTSEYIALLYQKYSYKLYHSAFRYTSNISTAEDGVQLVFEKILLHPKTALEVPEDEILYFLFAILRNVMYTITKDIFSKLKPSLRDTMIFHYCYGFKYREIADIFHISERAVKKRIATAKKQIKTMFRKEDFL